jgi:hypothetical protein
MRRIVDASPLLKHIVVADGDKSGAVFGQLDIEALTIHLGLARGVPSGRVWSKNTQRDGLQMCEPIQQQSFTKKLSTRFLVEFRKARAAQVATFPPSVS